MSSGEIEKVQTMYGNFFSWKDDLITQQLQKFSAHTRNELAMLKSFIKSGDNIVDIGAHIGTFSVPFARFNNGEGKVFAFEANPDNFELLKKNITTNNLTQSIIPTHGVVSEKEEVFTMRLPQQANSGMYYYEAISENDEIRISAVHIDKWYQQQEQPLKIDLIKIDVEGAELSVLNSCKQLIDQHRPIIYVEIASEMLHREGRSQLDIESFLSNFGYHFFRNIGKRNSGDDTFTLARIPNISAGGKFFDCIAIHQDSDRYPKHFTAGLGYKVWQMKMSASNLMRRMQGSRHP